MIKIQEVRELIRLIDQSGIEQFSYENDGVSIKLKKPAQGTVAVAQPVQVEVTPAPTPAQVVTATPVAAPVVEVAAPTPAPVVEADANVVEIKSPMVGTFYASSSPEADAYVKVGDKVGEESIVCIVEAVKLFNEIEAEVTGEIVEVLVKSGQLVEYGQPLFLVKA